MSIKDNSKQKAFVIIIIFGIISLFGDIIYEGARSVYGPFTKTISMDIVLVGFITGIAEFFGYFIRLVSGYLSDKTKAHWFFTIAGYCMLISVPLLSLTGIWQIVSVFIICERLGKALRSPSKDTILSQATKQIGTGWGFALHEALDQIGAIAGPLIFTVIFLFTKNIDSPLHQYQLGFKILWIPFILVIGCVVTAYFIVPDPENLNKKETKKNLPDKLSREFWLYTLFSFITTTGFISFVILGFYFKDKNIINESGIPFFYSIAMAVDGIAALIIGKIYDRLKTKFQNEKSGLILLIIIPLLTIFIPVFAFTGNLIFIVCSVVLWGIVMGTHETIMKSSIADLTHFKKRGTGYGIFNTAYGIAMFAGSLLFGFLYKINLIYIIIFVTGVEVIALLVYYKLYKSINFGQSA
jgi:MFS family permease